MEEFVYDVIGLDNWWWEVGRRALVASLVNRYGNNGSTESILEIGCGSGATIKELEGRGLVVGMDISPLALGRCVEKGIDTVCAADGALLPYRDEQFDVVISIDVLEHIDDDVSALQEIKRVCKPGGVAIFTVPAFQFLWSRRDDTAHHLRRYTLREVKKKVRQAGFRIRRATYINLPLFLPLFLLVKVGYLLQRNPSRTMDYVLVPSPINKVLSWIVKREADWLAQSDLPIGSSIGCVATK